MYHPNKDNGIWERELLQQEPYPIDIFAFEDKNVEFIGQETNNSAPEEATFPPQVERDMQAMQHLTNFLLPMMVLL